MRQLDMESDLSSLTSNSVDATVSGITARASFVKPSTSGDLLPSLNINGFASTHSRPRQIGQAKRCCLTVAPTFSSSRVDGTASSPDLRLSVAQLSQFEDHATLRADLIDSQSAISFLQAAVDVERAKTSTLETQILTGWLRDIACDTLKTFQHGATGVTNSYKTTVSVLDQYTRVLEDRLRKLATAATASANGNEGGCGKGGSAGPKPVFAVGAPLAPSY
ncbi:hypothetical protein DL93DRAFT_2161348 [Clavulina sp. PMI_390]|nr:hypothetical protein DL93DRAFT_2161348 [Clavulina sp. PMI_390]